jgi:hypothetical protein
VTNLFLPELNEATVAPITTATQDAPQRFRVMIAQYHGAMTRVRPSDMAFPLRELGYEVEVSSYWSAPGEKTSVVQWVNALRDKMKHLDFLILLLESRRSTRCSSANCF